MSEKQEFQQVAGCLLAVWSLIITSPMWLILLFMLMQANEMPNWSWVLYWAYVPCHLLGVIMVYASKVLINSKSND